MSLDSGTGARIREARGIGALEGWVDRLLSPLHRAAAGVSLTRADALAMAALWAVAAAWVWYGSGFFTSEAWADTRSTDLYVDSDVAKILDQLTHAHGRFTHSGRSHPLFVLLARPPVALASSLGIDRFLAVRCLLLLAVGVSTLLLHALARGIGGRTVEAAIATAVVLSSAAALHWTPVPETFAFSLATIAAPLGLLATSRTVSIVPWVAVTALSAAVTVTNGVAGGLAVAARHPARRAIAVGSLALAALVLLRLLQTYLFPGTTRMLDLSWPQHRLQFFAVIPPGLEEGDAGRPGPLRDFPWTFGDRVKALLLYAGVVPEPQLRRTVTKTRPDIGFVVSYEEAPLSALGLVGGIAAGAWGALLLLGLWGALRSPRRDVAAATLGFLLFHLALHMVFGELVFLFVLHSLPSYAALVAFALAGPQRSLALPLALLFLATAAPTNALRFTHAATLANGLLHGSLPRLQP